MSQPLIEWDSHTVHILYILYYPVHIRFDLDGLVFHVLLMLMWVSFGFSWFLPKKVGKWNVKLPLGVTK